MKCAKKDDWSRLESHEKSPPAGCEYAPDFVWPAESSIDLDQDLTCDSGPGDPS
jgi:hypothetical protein